MRLARPVYESLPFAYVGLGALALLLSYFNSDNDGGITAFGLGLFAQVAGLALYLHRQDCRSLSREYSREAIGEPQPKLPLSS
jgi:lipid-A-disaccharide synthase-like uncharacterized protein